MTLGEKIALLRNQQGMSQGDLAEKMNVSRQSISKWETDTSIPELDKLIQLSELFHITLDALVRGNTLPEEATRETEAPESPAPVFAEKTPGISGTQKIIGVILLCFGGLILLLLTVLGGFLSGLLFASPFVLCGVICLSFRRNVGLWCAWALVFAVDVYLHYATGIRWSLVLLTPIYEASMNYLRLAMAWVELACYIALVLVTVLRFRKKPLEPGIRCWCLLVGCCLLIALTCLPFSFPPASVGARLTAVFFDWVRLVPLTVVLTTLLRLLHGRRKKADR